MNVCNSAIRSHIQLHFLVTLFLIHMPCLMWLRSWYNLVSSLNYCENITIININYEKYINV